MPDEHDFITCENPECPVCAEAISQSTCDGCGGTVFSADGDYFHKTGCPKAKWCHCDCDPPCFLILDDQYCVGCAKEPEACECFGRFLDPEA